MTTQTKALPVLDAARIALARVGVRGVYAWNDEWLASLIEDSRERGTHVPAGGGALLKAHAGHVEARTAGRSAEVVTA